MPRQARIVIPGLAHHITQRGNYRQKIFDNEDNYAQYTRWINEYAKENDLDVLAYCLMSNHVHFIIIPKTKKDLAVMFKTVHMRYSHYINRQRVSNGHLWQGRFYSCILSDTHLYQAIRYVENNPVRAKIVKQAWQYKWSSAADRTEERDKPLIRLSSYKLVKRDDWKQYLKESDPGADREIRLKTGKGLVVGADKFIKKLEKTLKRSLQCLNQGRPRKNG
jgi:putative transposase